MNHEDFQDKDLDMNDGPRSTFGTSEGREDENIRPAEIFSTSEFLN